MQTDKTAKPKAPLTFRVTGQAQTSPDRVTIRFAAVADGDTLSIAEREMKKTEQAFADELAKLRVQRADMQLESFRAVPVQPGGISSSSGMKPLAYRVQRQYKVTMPVTSDSLDNVIKVADAAFAHGGRPVTLSDTGYDAYETRQASLMEFTVTDPDKLQKQAMTDALQRARKLAELAAADMGYASGAIKPIGIRTSDSGDYRYGVPEDRSLAPTSSWQPVKSTVSIEAEFDTVK